MKPYESHRSTSNRKLAFHLITVSSGRYSKLKAGSMPEDESGDLALRIIAKASHKVVRRKLVSDDKAMIRSAVEAFLSSKADVILLIGGTGVAPADITVEALAPYFEKELPGFGEILRNLSYRRIGGAALLTRATAGIAKGKLIVCLPGAPDAVGIALRSFIGEFPHVVMVAKST